MGLAQGSGIIPSPEALTARLSLTSRNFTAKGEWEGACGGNKPVAMNSFELDWTYTSNLEKEIALVLSGSAETPPTEAFRQEIKLQTLNDLSKFSYADPTLGTGHFCELLIEAVV
ncbi:hypothetical protein HGM15179_006512 [Zosterops borbonicus]|uniref:Uncharacterized protein n=1 Tax=Zosterops borbonicus TaxID=364589 RepID=A0A8K1LNC1_9PASS|nr:hypothetical protein HGM15179_006512 [Zosterops borbonicus]